MTRGLIVGAARSGSGKTSVAIGLMRALRRRGFVVAGAKSGPDYIDPGFHAAATGRPGVNLDSWAMAPGLLDALLSRQADGADLLIAESAMGLFDGVRPRQLQSGDVAGAPSPTRFAGHPGSSPGQALSPASRGEAPPAAMAGAHSSPPPGGGEVDRPEAETVRGSGGDLPARTGAAADLARRYDLPVLLVLDISGQSQTAAAIAHGFATFDPGVRIAGVVLNQVASERHERQAREAIEAAGIAVLGAIYRNPDMALPERHLGLVQASEHAALEAFIERLAEVMEKSLDLEAVLRVAGRISVEAGEDGHFVPPPGQRIAIAQDAAFSFVYPHSARHWREAGAELIPFSPLADEAPEASCDACWLPGGYPELHAGKLAGAANFKAGLARFAETRPVHGECGGYMVLGAALEDADGVTHAMTGLLGHVTSFARRKINLGYREARLLSDCPIGRAGETVRGHEFHYSRLMEPGSDEPLAELADAMGNALGPSGGRRGLVTGTYFHAIARG